MIQVKKIIALIRWLFSTNHKGFLDLVYGALPSSIRLFICNTTFSLVGLSDKSNGGSPTFWSTLSGIGSYIGLTIMTNPIPVALGTAAALGLGYLIYEYWTKKPSTGDVNLPEEPKFIDTLKEKLPLNLYKEYEALLQKVFGNPEEVGVLVQYLRNGLNLKGETVAGRFHGILWEHYKKIFNLSDQQLADLMENEEFRQNFNALAYKSVEVYNYFFP